MINFLEPINKQLKELDKAKVKVKVSTVTSVSPFKVKFDGESTEAQYLKPKNYTPTLNDRVYFLVVDGFYICLGAYN